MAWEVLKISCQLACVERLLRISASVPSERCPPNSGLLHRLGNRKRETEFHHDREVIGEIVAMIGDAMAARLFFDCCNEETWFKHRKYISCSS